jgi:pathogenesis-related protein 1
MKYFLSSAVLILAVAFAASAQKPKPKPKPTGKTTVKLTGGACKGSNGLTQAEITTILEEHNKVRTALGLGKLTWNCTLADTAQAWAARGVFAHRETDLGENIFVSTNPQIAIATAMATWEKEKPFWNNKAGTCQAGKTCTHYTQMVWRATTEIGCGVNRGAGGQWKTMMVCNYNPGGNTTGNAY